MADVPALTAVATVVADAAPAAAPAADAATGALGLLAARWIHYVAGVLWIGHLYFFNFVNLNLQADAKYPPEMKKVVNPLLMTRALFMFRWGAMFTFLSGLYLLYLIYGFGSSLSGPAAIGWANARGAYMALGAGFAIVMWFNVWFVIWPRQKKIISAAQGGPAVDPKLPKQAALASKINTYLSVPMLLGMMGGAHGDYQLPGGHAGLGIGILVGFAVVWVLYKLSPKVNTQLYKG